MTVAHYQNPPEYIRRAKTLRKESPMPERLLWNALCELRKETGFKFRRQQPLHPYIADFALMKARLVVEIDGVSHDNRQSYDAKRDAYLQSKGWTILRFMNEDVQDNLENVVLVIIAKVNGLLKVRTSPPLTPPARGGGQSALPSITAHNNP